MSRPCVSAPGVNVTHGHQEEFAAVLQVRDNNADEQTETKTKKMFLLVHVPKVKIADKQIDPQTWNLSGSFKTEH